MSSTTIKKAEDRVQRGRLGRAARSLALAVALLAVPAGAVRAQWPAGYGGYWMGTTLEEQTAWKEQTAALNLTQIELNASQAYRAQVEAALMWEQAALVREQARVAWWQSYRAAKYAAAEDDGPATPAPRPAKSRKMRRTAR